MTDIELYNYFQQKALREHALFQVEIDVTSACNAKCPFCFQGEHTYNDEKQMPFHKIVGVLNELREMGTYYIGFSGGEPFTRSDFLDILREAKKRLFRVSLITNAMLLDESKIETIAKLGIERITISFHSCVPEHYCSCFGISNSDMLEKVSNNISSLIRHGVSTGIAMTITNININDVEETTEYLKKIGILEKDINYNMLLTGKSQIAGLRPTKEEVSVAKKYLNSKVLNGKARELLCSAGTISCSIDSRGNVYPCTFFNTSAGNLYERSLSEIWNDSHLFTIIRNLNERMFEKCNECEIKGKCGLCLATNMNETGNIFLAPDEFCESRKARLGVI